MSTPTQVTPFTKYPKRSEPNTFYDDGDTFMSQLPEKIIGWNTQILENKGFSDNCDAKSDIASGAAITATEKAAIATAKANQILNYVIPTSATYSPAEIDAKDAVYRSERYAISGAIGKKVRMGAGWYDGQFTIYDGLSGLTAISNRVDVQAGTYYFKSLDKVLQNIAQVIIFPQAPTAVNLIINGTFDTDTSGYTATAGAVLSIDTQRLKVDVTANHYGSGTKTLATVIGKKYIVEANFTAGTGMGGLTVGTSVGGGQLGYVNNSASYKRVEFTATTTTTYIDLQGNGTGGYFFVDNLAAFESEQLLCYDNLLLKDDGTYVITRTEQNQYITMDAMLNYTSKVYSVANGADTGTTITMTYDMTNEEYSGSDGHKYLTIGATARFNQGAYHPVFNQYGCGYFTQWGVGNYRWFELSSPAISTAITAITSSATQLGVHAESGYYGSTQGTYNPGNKFYDIIYNELWIDQRWRAEWVDGTKERTTIERDKDIFASQYADFVGALSYKTEQFTQTTTGTVATIEVRNGLEYTIGDIVQIYDITASAVKGRFTILAIASNTITLNTTITKSANVYIIGGSSSRFRYSSNTFLHTDIIGNPTNYPQVWKDALAGGGSITGTPLLVGENGENYIIASGTGTIKQSKKMSAQGTYVGWSGAVYTNGNTSIDAITNAQLFDNQAYLYSYKAYNNNLASIITSKVVGGSAGVSDAIPISYHDVIYGARLGGNCTNKICTNNDLSMKFLGSNKGLTVGSVTSGLLVVTSATWSENPSHSPWTLSNTLSPTKKLFSYLTNSTNSSRHKQCYVFKEMKYDATGVNQDGTPTNTWGDNNQFNIVDNVSTITDNNGNTCLVGQKARLVDYRVKE